MKTLLRYAVFSILCSLPFISNSDVDVEKARKFAASKNCLACHAVDKKLVGPSYKEVAKKYKGDNTALEMLTTKIIKGGSGNWGPIPMPPNVISNKESKMLAEWILSM